MTGAIRFVDASAGVQPQEPSQRLLLDTAVTSFGTYLELWGLYGQKEWVREITRAAELQALPYTACVPASDEGGGWRLTVQPEALSAFRRRWERLGELHRELSQVNGQIATEQARSAQVYSMEDAQNPTVGWWKAARARAAMHTPTPTQAHAQAAGPRPSPKQATAQRATPPPTPTLSPAEALEKLAQARKAARALREREEQQRREREERQPGRSIVDDWLDGMLNKKDGPR